MSTSRNIAVIGAGPAGIFASKELSQFGYHVTLFNRDIKPGGLAEYGIYPTKNKLKNGLRRQFFSIIGDENVSYYGNLKVGTEADISIDELRALGFDAFLVTTGAQGTKWLGIPGEDLIGSYHAKDLVYYYNQLPPYSKKEFHIGKKVAIIGVGNVMMDIARYLIMEKKVEMVTAIARRGPAEIKFSRKELEYVVKNLDMDYFLEEMDRVSPIMTKLDQTPLESVQFIRQAFPNAEDTNSDSVFRIKFLASPSRLIGNDQNKITSLEFEENTLVNNNGSIKAVGTGQISTLDVDTVIFAIGDSIDPKFGIPFERNTYVKNKHPRFPIEGTSYESYDPASNEVIKDVFLAGWARVTSDGLVGNARKDGVNAARAVNLYLQSLQAPSKASIENIQNHIQNTNGKIINKFDLNSLLIEEARIASRRNLENFKFSSNEEMLAVIAHNRLLTGQTK
jgi:ferredoxin--NADP+ reductase